MRGGQKMKFGLRELAEHFPNRAIGIEVGSYAGESAEIFMASGRVAELTCVDSWSGEENEAAELRFNRVAQRWQGILKQKAKSPAKAPDYATQSVDFVYIDAGHDYENVMADIKAWRRVVKAGGLICGHDYNPLKGGNGGVVRAVNEIFGGPTMVFEDTSWMVRVPSNTYEILTYVSEKFWPCLKMSLPTMAKNCGAERVIVYSDSDGAPAACGTYGNVKYRKHFERSDDMQTSWDRKILLLQNHFQNSTTRFFIYMDADVFVRDEFKEAFFRMGPAVVGATRMFNATDRGRGEINAGIMFFQHKPELSEYLKEWLMLSEALKKDGKSGIWHEQHAASKLVHDAFQNNKPYLSCPLPEDIYNCEDDRVASWLERIENRKPKLIHFKASRWTDAIVRDKVRAVVNRIGGNWYDRILEPK